MTPLLKLAHLLIPSKIGFLRQFPPLTANMGSSINEHHPLLVLKALSRILCVPPFSVQINIPFFFPLSISFCLLEWSKILHVELLALEIFLLNIDKGLSVTDCANTSYLSECLEGEHAFSFLIWRNLSIRQINGKPLILIPTWVCYE